MQLLNLQFLEPVRVHLYANPAIQPWELNVSSTFLICAGILVVFFQFITFCAKFSIP